MRQSLKPAKIVSGGQTGAGRGGLESAIFLKIPHEDACDEYELKRDEFESAPGEVRDHFDTLAMYGDTSVIDFDIAEYELKLSEHDE